MTFKEREEAYKKRQEKEKEKIRKEPKKFKRFLKWCLYFTIFPFVWLWENLHDWHTFLIFLIVFLVVSSEIWVPYLLGFIIGASTTTGKWLIGIASACWLFWLGPGTPFTVICIGITMGIKALINRITGRSIKLTLYAPTLDDLWFRESLLSDPKTMSYNDAWGGTIEFSKESWSDWYNIWLNENDTTHFYRYLKAKKRFVGEVAYHFNDDKCMLDIIIHHKYRKRGYGTQGLTLLLDEIRKRNIEEVYDDIAIDNDGIKLFLNFGFEELYRTKDIIMLKKDLKEKSDTNVPD